MAKPAVSTSSIPFPCAELEQKVEYPLSGWCGTIIEFARKWETHTLPTDTLVLLHKGLPVLLHSGSKNEFNTTVRK